MIRREHTVPKAKATTKPAKAPKAPRVYRLDIDPADASVVLLAPNSQIVMRTKAYANRQAAKRAADTLAGALNVPVAPVAA